MKLKCISLYIIVGVRLVDGNEISSRMFTIYTYQALFAILSQNTPSGSVEIMGNLVNPMENDGVQDPLRGS